MEQSNLKKILNALTLYSEHVDNKINEMKVDLVNQMNGMRQDLEIQMDEGFKQVSERFEQIDKRFEQVDKRFEQVDKRFEQVDKRFEQVDKRFDNLGKKMDGIRVDLSETQETPDFLSSKVIQHEQKIRTTN